MTQQPLLMTFGHGTAERAELARLLKGARVEQVVDVRRFPGSRRHEAAARGHIEELCDAAGIGYRWDERLGGRRNLTAAEDRESPDTWWRGKAFRAYAAWTRTQDFLAGMNQLVSELGEHRTAVMCSESVWWRCHRRIIADVAAVKYGVQVVHLMHTGKFTVHVPSEGLRAQEDGTLVWDGHDGGPEHMTKGIS